MEGATHLDQSPHPPGDSEHSFLPSPDGPGVPGLVCLPTSLPSLCPVAFQIIKTPQDILIQKNVFLFLVCVYSSQGWFILWGSISCFLLAEDVGASQGASLSGD